MFRVLTLALVWGLFSSAFAAEPDPGDGFVCGYSQTSVYDGKTLNPIKDPSYAAATLDKCSILISVKSVMSGKAEEKWTINTSYRLVRSTLHDYNLKHGALGRDRVCAYAPADPPQTTSNQSSYIICLKHVRGLLTVGDI